MPISRGMVVGLLGVLTACGAAPTIRVHGPPRQTNAATSSAEGAPREELAWAAFSSETFARARSEGKYIVLDGSAEWCHWCHVMEATTYHDPAVRRILDRHFIAVKVDVDARPDIEERYGDWGWPATVMFAPDGNEIGKYRGYIAPDEFREILAQMVANGSEGGARNMHGASQAKAPRKALSEPELLRVQDLVEKKLDSLFDDVQGGWGNLQKAPLGYDNAWTLLRAERGDEGAKRRALFTLDQQSKLIDPVWGGIYQYSAASDWDSPHFEKLMTFQAPALENYAVAYRLTRDPMQLERADAMLRYLDRFMTSPMGGFYTTQDADLNAHDRTRPFMNGHAYYALDEKHRLAVGMPRVDTHEYGRENGLAIAAYCTMFEITLRSPVLASAERAAKRILQTHATSRGGIAHDVAAFEEKETLYLSDNAAFGYGLVRLYEVTKNADYLARAHVMADFMIRELTDEDGGGMFANTEDPNAVGVFAVRRVPFEDNVMAVRMFSHLVRVLPSEATKPYQMAIDRILRALSNQEAIDSRGRMIGDFLLALEESKGIRGVLQ